MSSHNPLDGFLVMGSVKRPGGGAWHKAPAHRQIKPHNKQPPPILPRPRQNGLTKPKAKAITPPMELTETDKNFIIGLIEKKIRGWRWAIDTDKGEPAEFEKKIDNAKVLLRKLRGTQKPEQKTILKKAPS